MKKTITLFTVLLAFCAAAGNTLLLDMESVASITSKGGKFHGGEFGEGPRVAEAISGGNRAFVAGGDRDGIELPVSVLNLSQGSISLYFRINKNAAVGKECRFVTALGTMPYYNLFAVGVVPLANGKCDINFNLIGSKGQKNAARSIKVKNFPLEKEAFYHLVATWKNLNSGKADASVKLYLDGKLIGQRSKEVISLGDIGKKLFIGSTDLKSKYSKNTCGKQAFVLDEVELSDFILSDKEIKNKTQRLPFKDIADGRILPGMPVKGGGKKQFTSIEVPDFPIKEGAIFCRFRLDEVIPGKAVLLFDNTATPAWNDRIALMLKMFKNNIIEYYFVVYGARTRTYTSKVSRKVMPFDPTQSHSVMVKWKNLDSSESNGVMEIYVNGVNVSSLNGFQTRFSKKSDVLRLGGGVPPSGVFARKDLLTIEEARIWRGDVSASTMKELFKIKSSGKVEAAIKLPRWNGDFKNDGKIDRKFWLRAADFGSFHSLRNKGALESTTQVKAACDDKNLYVMWQAKHPEPQPRGKKHGMRDMPLWRQDSLELHFDAPKGRMSILISAFGEIYDSLNKFASWNSSVKTAVSRIPGERIWCGTAVIPLSEITADDKTIKGAICRNISGLQDNTSSWTKVYAQCGKWEIGSELVLNNIAMPDMISVGSNTMDISIAAADRKNRTVFADLLIKNQGKEFATSVRRDMRLETAVFPLSFNVPAEGRLEYSLTFRDEADNVIWSNCGFMDAKPQLVLTLENEFFNNKLNVKVNAKNIQPAAIKGWGRILKDSQPVSKITEFKLNKGMADIVLDTSKMNQHTSYTAEITVVDQAGRKSVRTESFEFSPKPAGYPLNAGRKPYFGDFWFTPKFENGLVKCWNREYRWDNSIFPASIKSGNVEMLAQTPYFEYRTDGKLMRLSKAKVKPLSGDQEKTVFEVKAADENIAVTAQVRVEYDGFIGYELDAKPLNGKKIDKFAMIFPLKKESAQVKLQGLETTFAPKRNLIKNYPAEGRHFPFASKAGLGCFDRGFFLCLESDENWLPYGRENVEEIIPAGDKVLWRWNIVDGAVFKGITNQQIGFQVTPYKPLKKDQLQAYRTFQVYPGGILRPTDIPYKPETLPKFKAMGCNVIVLHLNWAKYTGGYEPDDRERFRKFIQEAHKLGLRVLVYRASITNFYEPSFLYYGKLWRGRPTSSFFGNPVNNKYKLSSSGRCTNAPGYIDWYVGMAAQLIKDYDVDGFYYDFGVGSCSNALHGCGYVGKNTTSAVGEATGTIGVNISEVTAEDRARRPTTPVLKQRELWKRMYNMVKELKGEAGLIDAHTSAPDRVFSYPFVDSMYHSESAATHKGMVITPEMYRLYFTKQSLGTRGELIVYIRGGNAEKQIRKMLALTLLHREIYRPMTNRYEYPSLQGYKEAAVVRLWNVFQRNKVDEAQWLPYWENKDYITIANGTEETLASLWRHDDRLLVVVSNLSKEPKELTVTLKGKCQGFKNAFDAELYKTKQHRKSRVQLRKNQLTIKLNAEDYKIIEITR